MPRFTSSSTWFKVVYARVDGEHVIDTEHRHRTSAKRPVMKVGTPGHRSST